MLTSCKIQNTGPKWLILLFSLKFKSLTLASDFCPRHWGQTFWPRLTLKPTFWLHLTSVQKC